MTQMKIKVLEVIDQPMILGYVDGHYVLCSVDEDGLMEHEAEIFILTPTGIDTLGNGFMLNENGNIESRPLMIQ